jgi:hypothetical protein
VRRHLHLCRVHHGDDSEKKKGFDDSGQYGSHSTLHHIMSSSLSPDSAAAAAASTSITRSSADEDIVPQPSPPNEAAATKTTISTVASIDTTREAEPKSSSSSQNEETGSQREEVVASHRSLVDSSPLSPTSLFGAEQNNQNEESTSLKNKNNHSKMEALEIDFDDMEEVNNTSGDDLTQIPGITMSKSQDSSEFDDEFLDRANADMEGLLSSSSNSKNTKSNNSNNNKRLYQTRRVTRRPKTSSSSSDTSLPCEKCCSCCINVEQRHGNCVVFVSRAYFSRTNWGIMGPHWFGPPCCAALIVSSSLYFIRHALAKIGPISASIGVMFTVLNLYLLINTCYRNPGIVMPANENDDSNGAPSAQHRW